MRRWLVVLLAVAVALGATGCAPVYTERSNEVPIELSNASNPADMTPAVAWAIDDDQEWLVLTWGSSSCPWEPKEVRETGDTSFVIRLEKTGGLWCTGDVAPTVYRVPAPVARDIPVTIDLGPGTIVNL